jgi:hypothetical protein
MKQNAWLKVMTWFVMISSLAFEGCGTSPRFPHVELSAPSADAPLQERLDAYARLAPASNTRASPIRQSRYSNHLELSDGTKVYWATDLLPVVPEPSRTAIAVQNGTSGIKTARTMTIIGGVATGVGSILVIQGLRQPGGSSLKIPFIAGGLLVDVGGIVTGAVALTKASKAGRDLSGAFGTYNADLRKRLEICRANDGSISDCTQPAALTPTH